MSIKSVILYCKLPGRIFWNCATNTNWKINWMLRLSGVAICNIQILHFFVFFSVKHPYCSRWLLKYQFYLFYMLRFYARSHMKKVCYCWFKGLKCIGVAAATCWVLLVEHYNSAGISFPWLSLRWPAFPLRSQPSILSLTVYSVQPNLN